jgi:hypothetical protein
MYGLDIDILTTFSSMFGYGKVAPRRARGDEIEEYIYNASYAFKYPDAKRNALAWP